MELSVVLNSVDFEKLIGNYCCELGKNSKNYGNTLTKEEYFNNTVNEIKKEASKLLDFFMDYQTRFNKDNKKKLTFTNDSFACTAVYMAVNNHTDIRLTFSHFREEFGVSNIKKVMDYFYKNKLVDESAEGFKTN
jgi:hypothetical protein